MIGLSTPDLRTRPDGLDRFRPGVRESWRASFLGDLADDVVAELLQSARETDVRSGEVLYGGLRASDPVSPALVVAGVVRVAVAGPQGRELTIAHAAAGDVVGLSEALLGDGAVRPVRPGSAGQVRAEGLEGGRLLKLSPTTFRRLVREDAGVAWAVARYLALESCSAHHLIARGVFLPVRARVARHLLDIAARDGRRLIARTTHQEIANAVGSVREVVSRVLRGMQYQRLVEQEGGQLVLVDSEGLLQLG